MLDPASIALFFLPDRGRGGGRGTSRFGMSNWQHRHQSGARRIGFAAGLGGGARGLALRGPYRTCSPSSMMGSPIGGDQCNQHQPQLREHSSPCRPRFSTLQTSLSLTSPYSSNIPRHKEVADLSYRFPIPCAIVTVALNQFVIINNHRPTNCHQYCSVRQ